VIRERKSANNIAALINESLRAVPELNKVTIVVPRSSEADAIGCNWTARQTNANLTPSSESLRLIEEIVRNVQHNFNLFEVH